MEFTSIYKNEAEVDYLSIIIKTHFDFEERKARVSSSDDPRITADQGRMWSSTDPRPILNPCKTWKWWSEIIGLRSGIRSLVIQGKQENSTVESDIGSCKFPHRWKTDFFVRTVSFGETISVTKIR